MKQKKKTSGLSQEELAEKLAVSRSAVAKWETDKGIPDINNLKYISQVLNVSIDYLLDDGKMLDLSVIKKSINLSDYTDKKINVINKKKIKDKIVRAEYPDANISTLLGEEKLTKSEKAVDTAILLFTPLIDMVKFSKQLNNLGNEYYLVTQKGRQYLAVVTDEYIESRELPEKIIDRKNERFEIGNFKFVNAGPIVYA